MASKLIYEVAASNGEYTDKQGNTKKRWVNCGKVFENDQGHMSMKLETVPVGPDWSGWFSFFVPKERDATPVTEHSAAKANAFVSGKEHEDDNIPF